MWIKSTFTVTSNLTVLPWIAHTNSITTGILTRRSGKSMTDYAGNTDCLWLKSQKKRANTMQSGRTHGAAQAGRIWDSDHAESIEFSSDQRATGTVYPCKNAGDDYTPEAIKERIGHPAKRPCRRPHRSKEWAGQSAFGHSEPLAETRTRLWMLAENLQSEGSDENAKLSDRT